MSNKPTSNIPVRERLLADAADLCALMGISRTRFDEMTRTVLPKPVKFGASGQRYWYLPRVRAWLSAGCPPITAWEYVDPVTGSLDADTLLMSLGRVEQRLAAIEGTTSGNETGR
jgi:predicted DNA-binding transcriptional regulator AlpA